VVTSKAPAPRSRSARGHPTSRRLVGYLRVSTGVQFDGPGLDVQERAIRVWCRQHSHRLVGWRRDEALSGAADSDVRAGLADALNDVEPGGWTGTSRRAEGIVVYRLDRLSRDVIVQESILREVWRLGGEVYSTASGEANLRDDPEDPNRRLIRVILGAIAEWERSMIALRMARGRALKRERGGYVDGRPPFGFRAEGKALVPDAAEQATVRRILELRGQGESLRGIVAALEVGGRPAKQGGRWHPRAVAAVVARAR
jgi:DNA invertase Pin-like site-specific DNA recombinase